LKIPIVNPKIRTDGALLASMKDVLESGQLSGVNKYVKIFEGELGDYLNVRHVVAMNSCSNALTLMLRAFNFKEGSEIIVPSFTFSGGIHPILWNNLVPVFVDSDVFTMNIDPTEIRSKITKKTVAILATHIFGNPCDVEILEQIASEDKINLFFDCAHAMGSKFNHRSLAEYGDASVYSFSPTKLLTTLEGGAVALNKDYIRIRLQELRNYGNDEDYDCYTYGLNGRMNEISALLGMHQLEKLPEFLDNRNAIAMRYKDLLTDVPGISFQSTLINSEHSYKDFAIRVNKEEFGYTADELQAHLLIKGIQTKRYFKQVERLLCYRKYADRLRWKVGTEVLAKEVLCLPTWNFMDVGTIDTVCDEIKIMAEVD